MDKSTGGCLISEEDISCIEWMLGEALDDRLKRCLLAAHGKDSGLYMVRKLARKAIDGCKGNHRESCHGSLRCQRIGWWRHDR